MWKYTPAHKNCVKKVKLCVLSGLDPILMRFVLHPSFGCMFFLCENKTTTVSKLLLIVLIT